MLDEDFIHDCKKWLSTQISQLTDKIDIISPSEWAETNRYLPANITPLPGYYRYSVNPALREIIDCLDVRSPIREITLMKGAQIGATVGILENAIGYYIAHVKSAPMMLLTADAELAKIRMDVHISAMLQQSNLQHLIKSNDELSRNKTGKTNTLLEWIGGGYLIPFGARNAAKLRSNPIQILLEDEIDGYPDVVGNDGDPMKLAEARTKAYAQTRKILRLSTPLIAGGSRVERCFKEGDQRYYYVPCVNCGEKQVLKFQGVDEETGEIWGLVWDVDNKGKLVQNSVFYVCKYCKHKHINADKNYMLAHGEWVSKATSVSPYVRSYHLSAMYSPASMYSWEDMVRDWLSAWNVEDNTAKDLSLLQEFYNNALGKPFKRVGKSLSFQKASAHRRDCYKFGEIPNVFAEEYCGSKILLLTAAVDVHLEALYVAIFGWTKGLRSFLIDYFVYKGDASNEQDQGTWGKLAQLIDGDGYIADDGTRYNLAMVLIDSGYLTSQVYSFCEQYNSNVCPCKGRDQVVAKNSAIKEFSIFKSKFGSEIYGITVDLYKDRLSAVLSKNWNGIIIQDERTFNAPRDITDAQLKELTVEQKRERINKENGEVLGYVWHRPSGSRNELWDLLVYNSAIMDIIAYKICLETYGLKTVDWNIVWNELDEGKLFYAV